MKVKRENLTIEVQNAGQVQILTYSDGRTAIVCKKANKGIKTAIKCRGRCPPVNRNENMTTEALKRTLNRYFERVFELDLDDEKCRFVSLTISKEKHNSYSKICERFKHFIGEVREKTKNHYIGTVRFIELQKNGSFHIHCILVFDCKGINLSDETLQKMWGWGFVEDKAIYDRFGLLDYLTNIKHSLGNKDNSKFTLYPKGARIIYISPNLPKIKNKICSLSPEELLAFSKEMEFEWHIKTHQYFDPKTKKVSTCIDKKILIQKNKKN